VLLVGHKGSACRELGFGQCHFLGRLQIGVESAFLSPSHAGGEGTRVFGFGPRRDDSERVCRKFSQLSRFGMYLIPNEEKKAKKFERGLNSRIQIMMSCFDIRDSSLLVD
jgi:hypothetical protein